MTGDAGGLAAAVLGARRDRGLSLHDLSRLADVSETALRSLEAGGYVSRDDAAGVALTLMSLGAAPVTPTLRAPARQLVPTALHPDGSRGDAVADATRGIPAGRDGPLAALVRAVRRRGVCGIRVTAERAVVAGAAFCHAVMGLGVAFHLPMPFLAVWGCGPCMMATLALIPVFGEALDRALEVFSTAAGRDGDASAT